jgi:zinc transport system ATP-binding protein
MPVTSADQIQTQPLLCLDNVTVQRNGEKHLDRINLCIIAGEIVTLVGPNGAGKSTLVKTALGLLQPTLGQVIRPKSLIIGYVPQSLELEESMPVTVRRFLSVSQPSGDFKEENLHKTLSLVGAPELLDRPLKLVSGGEMRRIILARALLKKPDLLILDEPTSGVDVTGQAALYSLIADIRDEYHCGVLLVSHNLHIVMAATDRVICLNRHLCCSGTPEDVRAHPQFVSLFGQHGADTLGIYRHHHDHEHNLSGEIRHK